MRFPRMIMQNNWILRQSAVVAKRDLVMLLGLAGSSKSAAGTTPNRLGMLLRPIVTSIPGPWILLSLVVPTIRDVSRRRTDGELAVPDRRLDIPIRMRMYH